MTRLALPLLLLTSFVVAAPVPKADQQKLRAAFGTVPESASGTVTFKNGRLTLTSDAVRRVDFDVAHDKRLPLHTEHELKGDFTVEVTLSDALRPKQEHPKHDARVRSGLYVRSGNRFVILGKFVRVATSDDGKRTVHDESLWLQDGGHGTRIAGLKHDETAQVRIARTKGIVEIFYLVGKNQWKRTGGIESQLADEVTVGVALMPEVDQMTIANFSDFHVGRK